MKEGFLFIGAFLITILGAIALFIETVFGILVLAISIYLFADREVVIRSKEIEDENFYLNAENEKLENGILALNNKLIEYKTREDMRRKVQTRKRVRKFRETQKETTFIKSTTTRKKLSNIAKGRRRTKSGRFA